jgi:hypothetical protein
LGGFAGRVRFMRRYINGFAAFLGPMVQAHRKAGLRRRETAPIYLDDSAPAELCGASAVCRRTVNGAALALASNSR